MSEHENKMKLFGFNNVIWFDLQILANLLKPRIPAPVIASAISQHKQLSEDHGWLQR